MTPRQRDLLVFIASYQQSTGGVSPTFDEMAAYLRLRSKSGVMRILEALERDGFISRKAKRQRAIEVLREPVEAHGNVIPIPATGAVLVPVYGQVPDVGMSAPSPALGPYPFLSHRTCAEWMGLPVHGRAA